MAGKCIKLFFTITYSCNLNYYFYKVFINYTEKQALKWQIIYYVCAFYTSVSGDVI